MPFYAQHVRAAQTHLKKADPKMREVIRRVGPFTLKAHRNSFNMLVRSIVSQQISTAAARTIMGRVHELAGGDPLHPEMFADMMLDQLRAAGVSQQKGNYILDLSKKALSGAVDFRAMGKMNDEEVVEQLIQVKGIGVWTAHMFLIFSLARMDVLPTGDFGIKSAVQRIYGLSSLPKASEIESIAQPWRPYASIASWYLWRALELPEYKNR